MLQHSATRALMLLEALNTRQVSYVRELAADTQMPKPSIVRLLRMLADEGYVQRVGPGAYAVCARVQRLSSGFRDDLAVVAAARRAMDALTREIHWPLALGVLERSDMVVRYSTIPSSPLAWHRSTLFARLSLIRSGMGQAVLAFLDEAVREALLDTLAAREFSRPPYGSREQLAQTLAQVRQAGYAVRRKSPRQKTVSVSVPVLAAGRPVAGLSVTVFGPQMTPSHAAQTFAPHLMRLAATIGENLDGSAMNSQGGAGSPA